jgi:DNA modification methylase
MIFQDAPELKYLVTFTPNKRHPIHGWYWYKEGFSKDLVDNLIERFNLDKSSTVLDPFCGVGTTPLACKQHRINSIGFDVSPLCVFVSDVKTKNYNLEKLGEEVKKALKWKFKRPDKIPNEKWLKKIFSKYALEDIVFLKGKIKEIEDEKIRNFLTLGLIDSSMKCSFAYKDGAFVRIVKRPVAPLQKIFKSKIRKMLRDLKNNPLENIEPRIEIGDARQIELEDNSVDAIITSPPYLNKIEYTKIYKTEYSLFFDLPETKIRSFIGERTEGEEEFKDLPPVAQAYFKDMRMTIEEMYRVCKSGANVAIIVGGGCFPDQAIQSDEILANIAGETGFEVDRILVARKLWCTRARTIKVDQMRESVILLKKP